MMTHLDGLERHVHPGEITRIGQNLGTDKHGDDYRLEHGKQIGITLIISTATARTGLTYNLTPCDIECTPVEQQSAKELYHALRST